MEDEKKYSIVGEVKIGTDEYRDLIEGLSTTKAELDKSRSDYWDMRSKFNAAETQIKTLREDFTILNNFVNSSEEMKAKFKTWRLEQMLQEKNKDEQN